MGAHESNKGLCPALHRAFRTLACKQVLADQTAKRNDDLHQQCVMLLERITQRHCQPADNVTLQPQASQHNM